MKDTACRFWQLLFGFYIIRLTGMETGRMAGEHCFLLLIPLGFLLPAVFVSCEWSCGRILCAGALASMLLFMPRFLMEGYIEMNVFLPAAGALAGYLFYGVYCHLKESTFRAVKMLYNGIKKRTEGTLSGRRALKHSGIWMLQR